MLMIRCWTQAKFETGTICGELLDNKIDIRISNAADGGPQPFAHHDAIQACTTDPCSRSATDISCLHAERHSGTDVFKPSSKYIGMMCHRPPVCCQAAAQRES